VVVDQDEPWTRSFVRDGPGGRWDVGPVARGLDATLWFSSLTVGVRLAEAYAKVRLPPPPADDGAGGEAKSVPRRRAGSERRGALWA